MDFIFNIFGFNSKIGKVSENLCKIIILFFSNPYFKEKKKKKLLSNHLLILKQKYRIIKGESI